MHCLIVLFLTSCALSIPTVVDQRNNVTYIGATRNTLDVFLNIRFGQDTSGPHRFRPPRPYVPSNGSVIDATSYGQACLQQPGSTPLEPIVLTNVSDGATSEDCLNLVIVRPNNTDPGSRLPVLFFIHGGSFWEGSTREVTTTSDGLVLQSIQADLPIIHVHANYRLGASLALFEEGSGNAGLRDQRLAIEWVVENIEQFGGDPGRITIHGQSSGGLAVGMQTLAYGGSRPVPFQQGICESQALEPGITGNFTRTQMQLLADATGCNKTTLDSNATIECLRSLDSATFAQASYDTYFPDIQHNIGDSWLPSVDGDFLPAAPSQLLAEGRFANVTTMILWCENDMQFFTPTTISTSEDTAKFLAQYVPGFTNASVQQMLDLYPSDDFQDDLNASHTREFYRAARMFRDIIMTCQPIWYGENLARLDNEIYLVDQNKSILPPILAYLGNAGLGPVHTSEFAYTFGNLSHYNINGYPFSPDAEDYRLQTQMSRSWAAFTTVGQPSLYTRGTLQGMAPAFAHPNHTALFVVGGDSEGMSYFDGEGSTSAIAAQKLRERCGFLNSPDVIMQLAY